MRQLLDLFIFILLPLDEVNLFDPIIDYHFFYMYRYAIVRDMTAAGAGLDKFCYAGLITAHKNKIPLTDDTASKVRN